jgi:hypothetical protein
MSLQATPNQPLDWQLLPLGDAECPDCPPSDYCSPMLFERYLDSGSYYYRSKDYFSFSIEGSLAAEDMCPIDVSAAVIDREENAKTTFNVDGSITIDFGPTSGDEPDSFVEFTDFPVLRYCPLVFTYCVDWDTECEGCESSRVYPVQLSFEISGTNTPAQTRTITINSPDELEKCSTVVFSNILDNIINLKVNGTETVRPTFCDIEAEPPVPCTSQITFATYTACNVVPLNIVTANGTPNEWGGAFNLIHYNFGTIDGETYYITGVYQIDGIPEQPIVSPANSPFSLYVDNCMKINIAAGDCCNECEQQVFESVCIKPILDPCGTVRVEYYQDVTATEDAFGFGFYYPATSPTFTQHMRLPGNVRDAKYDGTMISYQDSLGRKRVVYAERRKALSFNTGRVPEYVHDALSLACRHDNFLLEDALYSVDDNFFTRTTEYTPTYIRMSRLAPVSLEVEAKTQDLKKNMCI